MGKSAFAAWLVPEEARDVWYTDQMEFQGDAKRQIEAMKGRAIVEFSEMIGLTKADIGRVKSFITRLDDGATRMVWRTDPEPTPRMCAFLLTTNMESALPNDPSGNRRFVCCRLDPRRHEARRPVEPYLDEHREQLWAEALHRVRTLKQKPGLPRSLKEAQMSTNERHRARDAGVEEAIAEVFPKGVAYPGLTLEQIALLTDFNLKTERSEGKEGGVVKVYQPWAQIANRESARLRQALANVADTGAQWQQSASKLHARPDAPAYRWYTNNEDAPEADGFREEAAWRKHQSATAGGDPNAPREGPDRAGRGGDPSSPPQTKW